MLPSNMELRIKTGTVRYNNKILISDGKFNLGKNENVNSLEAHSAPQVETPAIKTNSLELTHAPTISHEDKKPKIKHSNEKIALVLTLAHGFAIWNMFG